MIFYFQESRGRVEGHTLVSETGGAPDKICRRLLLNAVSRTNPPRAGIKPGPRDANRNGAIT